MSGKYATETILADAAGIARAAQVLRDGGLVAVPTETVYGLAARADSEEAVARIYEAKGRPSFNPLIVHVRDTDQARSLAEFPDAATRIAADEWPGPVTLVLPRKPEARLAPAITAGLGTVALRVPAHLAMRALLGQVDFPLAAPSANRSGYISPTTAGHVSASLDGRIDLILDGGECRAGLESTILAVRPDNRWQILRPGPVSPQDIAEWHFGGLVAPDQTGEIRIEAPGQLASHYAPGKPVRLAASEAEGDEFLIGFGDIEGDINLSPAADLKIAASRLYACLYAGAASDRPRIAVASIPDQGIGKAINDRLRRAATPPD